MCDEEKARKMDELILQANKVVNLKMAFDDQLELARAAKRVWINALYEYSAKLNEIDCEAKGINPNTFSPSVKFEAFTSTTTLI